MVLRCVALILAFVLTCITFLTLILSGFSNDLIVYIPAYGKYSSGFFMGCVYTTTEDHCDTSTVYMKKTSFTTAISSDSDPKTYQENVTIMIYLVSLNQTVIGAPNGITSNTQKEEIALFLGKHMHSVLDFMGVSQNGTELEELIEDTKNKILQILKNPQIITSEIYNLMNTFFAVFNTPKDLTSAYFIPPAGRVGNVTVARIIKPMEGSYAIVLARLFLFISVFLVGCCLVYIALKIIFKLPRFISHFFIIQCITTGISLLIFIRYANQDIKKAPEGVRIAFGYGFYICCVSFGSAISAYVLVILSECLLL